MCGRMTFLSNEWMHPILLGKNESLKVLTLFVEEIKGNRLQAFTGSAKNMNSQIQIPEWNYEINLLTTSLGWTALQYWLKLLTDYGFTLCNHHPLPTEVALFLLVAWKHCTKYCLKCFHAQYCKDSQIHWIYLLINILLLLIYRLLRGLSL